MEKVISPGLILLFFLFVSCERVIHVDLNSSSPVLVVEANIPSGSYATAKLSKSVNYDEENSFPAVSGAEITVTDNAGGTDILRERSPGFYAGSLVRGEPGRKYTMTVKNDGNTYVAQSIIVAPVVIDSVKILERNEYTFNPGISLSIKFWDREKEDNYYRFVTDINGREHKSVMIADDELRDGDMLTVTINPRDDDGNSIIKRGDTVALHLRSVDKSVYDYFRTLLELRSAGYSGTTPANPLSNFSGGALGYFCAYSESRRRIIIR